VDLAYLTTALGYQRASGHDADDEIIISEKARAMDVTGRDGLELPWFELELNIFKQGECIRTWTNGSPPMLPSLRATVKVRCSACPANEDRPTSDHLNNSGKDRSQREGISKVVAHGRVYAIALWRKSLRLIRTG
jgi:hypothetical protein